jgi:hypothetical protein
MANATSVKRVRKKECLETKDKRSLNVFNYNSVGAKKNLTFSK